MDQSSSNWRSTINPPVFFGSAALILALVVTTAVDPGEASKIFADVQNWIVNTFGWFYLLAVAVFLIFCIFVALSSYGNIKLGPDHSEPDYSYLSWFAMLFSAGMGIGLLFFGVAEPVMHFANPPVGEGQTIAAAREAMTITFFHWGLHAWAIFAVTGLALAYFSFRHGLPLTIRSALYPLIGERVHGPIGHAVDIFAVLGTMFGVATSLGFGVLQVNAGLHYLTGMPATTVIQVTLIAVITLMATASVVSGLNVGIRRLSEANLILAALLLLFVLVAGPTLYLLQTLVQNTGAYLSEVVNKTFNLYAYKPTGWIGGWTLFYWGWWISWSPFVGMFIARVSRGRTIREFIFGVLFVPVGFTFLWMTFFGNTAIHFELSHAGAGLSEAVANNVPIAIFKLFEQLPWTTLSSSLATLLVVTFFVTSSDSGSLVIDIITSGGHAEPPVWQRIFWALTEGVVAAVLLTAGGLKALQTAAITSALPFAVVMLVVCYGLLRGLRMERLRKIAYGLPPAVSITGERISWQNRLKHIVSHPRKDKVSSFLESTVMPALNEVAEEIRKHGLKVEIEHETERAAMVVYYEGEADFIYAVQLHGQRAPSFAVPDFDIDRDERHKYYRAEVHLAEGGQHYDIMGYTKEQVIGDILQQYDKHMHFLHLAR